jgi:hypothetical protein
MKRVDGGDFGRGEVQETAFEYGVAYDNGMTVLVDDEHEARDLAATLGGTPVIRALHFMAWAELGD